MPATPVAPAAATAPLESPAKFLVAYLLYFLLNGVINMKQGSLVAPEETVPEVDSEEITRLESECTIWWQPPLWWDQTPMWMSRAPRWLNDVAVRDDSALLQVGEERGAEEAQAVVQLDEAERARLDGLLERLRSQQHMVALNHHLVRGVDSVLARLEEPSTRAGRGGGEGAPA